MANTTLTHQMLAREAADIFMEEGNFIKFLNRERESDIGKETTGYKSGNSVRIKIPPVPVTYSGSLFAGGAAAPDNVETSVLLTVDKQEHVPVTFTAVEKVMNIADFKETFLRPAVQSLVSKVEANAMIEAYKTLPNVLGTAGTIPTTISPYAQARGMLNRFMAPTGMRTSLVSSDVNANMVSADRVLFNPRSIADQYATGAMGDTQGMNFFENQSLPTHTNGTQASWTVTGAGQTGSTLNISGLTAAQTILRGTVFTIAGVRSVHPITGVAHPAANLRSFVVTADFTAAGATGAISIYPPITPTTATVIGTVNASPAPAAACTMFGAASSALRQNLIFQKNAIAMAFVPLPKIASTESYTYTTKDFSIRVMTFGNGQTDTESTRIDVLFGQTTVRPDHAARVSE